MSRQERDQAERVLERVGDGVFLVDHDGVIRLWNPAAEAITGLRAEAISKRPAVETIPGWEAIAARVPVASRPGDADDASSPETVPLDLGGRELWLSIVGVTLPEGTVYAFRDVTRERRLEELRSEFVATISHELRTPLASLHGAALTLREHGPDLTGKTQQELLDMIAVQSRRLADLVDEILVTGQLDSGSLRVVTEPFDPEDLVWAVAETARHRVGDETTIDVDGPGRAAARWRETPSARARCSPTCSTTRSSTRRRAGESSSAWRPTKRMHVSSSATRASAFRSASRN